VNTMLRPATIVIVTILSGSLIGCRRAPQIDYGTADPIADARRALLDSGHFHLLVIKVGDSLVGPKDTTVLLQRTYNVQVGPEGAFVILPTAPVATREAQLRYIRRYNTQLYALLDTNAKGAGLLPNKRLKLPARVN
jgi:hypothetical protein